MTVVVADCKTRRFSTGRTQNANDETTPIRLVSRTLGPDSLLRMLHQLPLRRVPDGRNSLKANTVLPIVHGCNLDECLEDTVGFLKTHDAIVFAEKLVHEQLNFE